MLCPKCSAPRAEGASECSVCGVIYARYRRTTAAGTSSGFVMPELALREEPPPATSSSAILWVVAAIVLLAVGGWTVAHYDFSGREKAFAARGEEAAITPVITLKDQQKKWNAMSPEEREKATAEVKKLQARSRKMSDSEMGLLLALGVGAAIAWRIVKFRAAV